MSSNDEDQLMTLVTRMTAAIESICKNINTMCGVVVNSLEADTQDQKDDTKSNLVNIRVMSDVP